jgi:hypothetical protein
MVEKLVVKSRIVQKLSLTTGSDHWLISWLVESRLVCRQLAIGISAREKRVGRGEGGALLYLFSISDRGKKYTAVGTHNTALRRAVKSNK